jgi:uncharacterized membrane protein YdjX (TVP38/TMEM64 family)
MKWYAAAGVVILTTLLALFVAAENWGGSVLELPPALLQRTDPLAAVTGVGLLTADVVLPVPSSLVMMALGAGFGALMGTVLSVAGSMGAMLAGFALGRRGEPVLARMVSADERAAAGRLLTRYGALAIVVTRPVPLLAETVAILTGASPLGWRRAVLAALAGTIPAAAVYATAGAAAAGSGNVALVIAATVVVSGGAWLVERRLTDNTSHGRHRQIGTVVSA